MFYMDLAPGFMETTTAMSGREEKWGKGKECRKGKKGQVNPGLCRMGTVN